MRIKRGNRVSRNGADGFSLIELAIVLVVIAVLLSAGIMAWRSVIETRKIAKSASVLYQVRDCLIRRVAFSERYPTYRPGTTLATNCNNADMSYDVDACLCEDGMVGAWGNRVIFIEGLSSAGGRLQGLPLVTDEAKGMTRTKVHADSDAVDHKGTQREDIAFILVGENQEGLSPAVTPVTINGLIGTLDADPDFQNQDDDVYLIVTSQELLSKVR